MRMRRIRLIRARRPPIWTNPRLTYAHAQDPAPENAGLYKCIVSNKYGEINANLSLNIEVAPVIRWDKGHSEVRGHAEIE